MLKKHANVFSRHTNQIICGNSVGVDNKHMWFEPIKSSEELLLDTALYGFFTETFLLDQTLLHTNM